MPTLHSEEVMTLWVQIHSPLRLMDAINKYKKQWLYSYQILSASTQMKMEVCFSGNKPFSNSKLVDSTVHNIIF